MQAGCFIKEGPCGIDIAFKIFFSKWKPFIIKNCQKTPGISFSEICINLPDVSDATIWRTIKELKEDGVLQETSLNNRSTYSLTEKGAETYDLIMEISQFAYKNGCSSDNYDDLVSFVKKSIGSKWKSRIINVIFFDQRVTFNEIERSVMGITHKVLAESLGDLLETGVIKKEPGTLNNVKIVAYYLTPVGYDAAILVKKVTDWALKHHLIKVFD